MTHIFFEFRKLAGKVIYISGASRGIGKAIALKAAKDGAKVVVAAKTAEPHPKLKGTIYTAAEESKNSKQLPLFVEFLSRTYIKLRTLKSKKDKYSSKIILSI